MFREKTKEIQIGNVTIGGGNKVAIQSMTNTKTEDVEATVAQILALEKAGCEIIRCAVLTMEAAQALGSIKKQIHFLFGNCQTIIKMNICHQRNMYQSAAGTRLRFSL